MTTTRPASPLTLIYDRIDVQPRIYRVQLSRAIALACGVPRPNVDMHTLAQAWATPLLSNFNDLDSGQLEDEYQWLRSVNMGTVPREVFEANIVAAFMDWPPFAQRVDHAEAFRINLNYTQRPLANLEPRRGAYVFLFGLLDELDNSLPADAIAWVEARPDIRPLVVTHLPHLSLR